MRYFFGVSLLVACFSTIMIDICVNGFDLEVFGANLIGSGLFIGLAVLLFNVKNNRRRKAKLGAWLSLVFGVLNAIAFAGCVLSEPRPENEIRALYLFSAIGFAIGTWILFEYSAYCEDY